jgi:hypothetical protein
MGAGKLGIRERWLMIRTEYSVLKGEIEDNDCGWSHGSPLSLSLYSFF